MVRFLFLAVLAVSSFPVLGWELTIAFTNDLHVALENLELLEPYLLKADLVLDAGDTWEDLYRLTDFPAAEEIARWMERVGYDAKVLGNHDAYLGPSLVELIRTLDFAVLGTNIRGIPGVVPWISVQRNGLRILILGFLGPKRAVYFPYPLWPKARVLDPIAAAQEALGKAPEHDLLIIVAHMELADAVALALSVPECALLVLGHDHLFLEEPVWAGHVPIVQAGHRAQAVGLVTLNREGLRDYRLIRVGNPPRTSPVTLLPIVFVALLFLLGSVRQ